LAARPAAWTDAVAWYAAMKARLRRNDSFFFDFATSLGTLQLPDPRRVGRRFVIVDHGLRVAVAGRRVVVVAVAQQVDSGDAAVAPPHYLGVRRPLEGARPVRVDELYAIAAVDRGFLGEGCGRKSPDERNPAIL